MSKKTTFNRIDTIKNKTAKLELARAHSMVALLGSISIILLWTLHASIEINTGLAALATVLLALIILFSSGVVYMMLKSGK